MLTTKKLLFVVGTRPNIMKLAPVYHQFNKHTSYKLYVMHTGQHYDFKMSKVFFHDLDLPEPDIYLDIEKSSPVQQIAEIMKKSEIIFNKVKPHIVFVFGDVNSTMASSIAAKKLKITLAHVEAGLRSFDSKMPEEINRIIVDTISDIHFITEESGVNNLKREGHSEKSMFLVGNTMIDSLVFILNRLNNNFRKKTPYIVLTLHRPQNVDNKENLINILSAIKEAKGNTKVIFPIHPRTLKNIKNFGILEEISEYIEIVPPMSYKDFIRLIKNAKLVITDSGGIQEETTFLGVPCITVRNNTERPITTELGTNVLAGTKKEVIIRAMTQLMKHGKKGKIPLLWDGRAAERIRKIIEDKFL